MQYNTYSCIKLAYQETCGVMRVNVVIYCRTANDAEPSRRYGVDFQENDLLTYCKIKNYNVLCVFKSVCGGKILNRDCLNEMIDFIKLQNGNIHKVICQTYDRIGRNMISNIQFEEKLKSFGCEIEVANFNNQNNNMNAIIYNRVSTDQQAQFGYSIEYQNDATQRYCEFKGYNVVEVFNEDFSAKNFEKRPEWNKLFNFIKRNKGLVQRVVMLRHDRYSRNFLMSFNEEEKLKKLGCLVEFTEGNVDIDLPESLVVRAIQYALPEIENQRNSKRTKEGLHRARMNGCVAGQATKGYRNIKFGKDSTMEPNEFAPFITESFTKMASGNYSADEVRRWLNSKGLNLSKNHFPNMIKNVSYIGKIYVKPFMGMPARIVEGLHPAIVSDEIFAAANDALNGRKRSIKKLKDTTELFPLNKLFYCPIHHRSLTGNKPKSRSGAYYSYYTCTSPGSKCKNRYRAEYLEDKVVRILKGIQLSALAVKKYKRVLKSVFNKEDILRNKTISELQQRIHTGENRLNNLQNQFLDGNISSFEEYMNLKQVIDLQLYNDRNALKQLSESLSPFDEYLNQHVPRLEDLVGFYQNSNGKIKSKVLGCIFSDKIEILEGENTTTPISEPFALLLNIGKGLQGVEKEKEVNFDLFPICAPRAGLEPATY